MSRATALAQRLRELKLERDELFEKKSSYDHDTSRAVAALEKFTKIIKSANSPDNRRQPTIETTQPENIENSKKEEEIIEEIEKITSGKVPPWAKKAFRAIALLTHPDKVNNDPNISDAQRDRLVSIYREASEAFHNAQYEIVAEIAAELEIQIEIPVDEMELAFERKIAGIKHQIVSMQKTISWVWGTSFGEREIRIKILRQISKIIGVETPDENALNEIIKELESMPDFDIIDRLGNIRRIKSGAERRKVGTRPEKRIR